jgi:carbon storage regulator
MLVLTRRPGEQIVIGNNIRVTVVSVGPGRVKIGIEAPENVRIDRSEIHERIQQEQASDVLAAVGRGNADDPSPTIVSGPDTDLKIHNRIADTVAAPAVTGSATAGVPANGPATPTPLTPLTRARFMRKPR